MQDPGWWAPLAAGILRDLGGPQVARSLTQDHIPPRSRLFFAAFRQSSNAMALVDDDRRAVDVNDACVRLLGYPRTEIIGRRTYEFLVAPVLSDEEWRAGLAEGRLAGTGDVRQAGGERVAVEWAGTSERVSGDYLILLVALRVSRHRDPIRLPPQAGGAPASLSRREREIVGLVALGNTGPEIAARLGIEHNTVRTHVRNAMVRLEARSRAHLVAKALGHGLIPDEDFMP
jgi:PAS domain S-box-containing protein